MRPQVGFCHQPSTCLEAADECSARGTVRRNIGQPGKQIIHAGAIDTCLQPSSSEVECFTKPPDVVMRRITAVADLG
jgi:hypothetical protein